MAAASEPRAESEKSSLRMCPSAIVQVTGLASWPALPAIVVKNRRPAARICHSRADPLLQSDFTCWLASHSEHVLHSSCHPRPRLHLLLGNVNTMVDGSGGTCFRLFNPAWRIQGALASPPLRVAGTPHMYLMQPSLASEASHWNPPRAALSPRRTARGARRTVGRLPTPPPLGHKRPELAGHVFDPSDCIQMSLHAT